MDRLISEKEVLKAFEKYLRFEGNFHEMIKAISSAEPKTGYREYNDIYDHYLCGNCKTIVMDYDNFCPNCGRKMFKTGSWLFYGRLLKCSNCGYINDDILDECPNCKISMVEPQEGAEDGEI